MSIRPLLASPVDLNALKFPCYISPKIDGVRGLITTNGHLQTRSGKPLANTFTQRRFSHMRFAGLDGELCVGSACSAHLFRNTQSALSTISGEPQAVFHVFDDMSIPNEPFLIRYASAMQRVKDLHSQGFPVCLVEHILVKDLDMLERYEWDILAQGYEGVMIRAPQGRYKYGRSTTKEQILLKLKRFETSEARIVGFTELMHNNNDLESSELGYAKRSSHKENLDPGDTLGTLLVKDIHHGWEFGIGTGFTANERYKIWRDRDKFLGKIVSYTYLKHGMKDVPRHPSYQGFRMVEDLSNAP